MVVSLSQSVEMDEFVEIQGCQAEDCQRFRLFKLVVCWFSFSRYSFFVTTLIIVCIPLRRRLFWHFHSLPLGSGMAGGGFVGALRGAGGAPRGRGEISWFFGFK